MKQTVFLLGFLPNPRMYKRFALAEEYSNVHVICWDRTKDMMPPPPDKADTTFSIIREDLGGSYLSRFAATRRFKKQANKILREKKPDIVHVQNLDMLQIACSYKKQHPDVRIIYEVADLHRLLVDKQKSLVGKCLQKYLLSQDRKCSKSADLLIVTSQKYFDTYFKEFVPANKVLFFPNVPDLSVFEGYKAKDHSCGFTVGYIGGIRYKREMRLLVDSAIRKDFPLIIAGFEQGENEIEELCKGHENITWLGRYDFKKEGAELYGRCDCIYSVYDASMENCKVALPNKLYEAVYCELPIIVAANTYVAEIVEDWGVGVAAVHDSQESVDNAIQYLMDPDNYLKCVVNCRKHKNEIDLKTYNGILKKRLATLFE